MPKFTISTLRDSDFNEVIQNVRKAFPDIKIMDPCQTDGKYTIGRMTIECSEETAKQIKSSIKGIRSLSLEIELHPWSS